MKTHKTYTSSIFCFSTYLLYDSFYIFVFKLFLKQFIEKLWLLLKLLIDVFNFSFVLCLFKVLPAAYIEYCLLELFLPSIIQYPDINHFRYLLCRHSYQVNVGEKYFGLNHNVIVFILLFYIGRISFNKILSIIFGIFCL